MLSSTSGTRQVGSADAAHSPANNVTPSSQAGSGMPVSVIGAPRSAPAPATVLQSSGSRSARGDEELEKLAKGEDSKQAELFNLQWKLLREQMGSLAKDVAAVRQEANNAKLAEQREDRFQEFERKLAEHHVLLTETAESERAQRVASDEKIKSTIAELGIKIEESDSLHKAAVDSLEQGFKRSRQNSEMEIKANNAKLTEIETKLNALAVGSETEARERVLNDEQCMEELGKLRANVEASTRRLNMLKDEADRESSERREGDEAVRATLREAIDVEQKVRTSADEELKRVTQQLQLELDEEARMRREGIEECAQSLREAVSALSGDLRTMEQKLHDLVARECQGRGEDIDELRRLIGGEQLARTEHHGTIMTLVQEDQAKRDAAHTQLQERLDAHGSAMKEHVDNLHGRLDGHAESLEERFAREEKEREELHGGHSARHESLSDKLQDLEHKLHDLVSQECRGREADIDDIRKLVGGEALARVEHHGHIMSCMEEEKVKRDAAHAELHGRLDGHAETLEERFAREQEERESLNLSLHAKLDDHGSAIHDKIGENSGAHEGKHNTLLDKLVELEEKLHDLVDQECKGREEDIDNIRKLVGGEALARAEHHGHIMSCIDEERARRGAAHAELHGRLDGHAETLEVRFAREQEERETLNTSLHAKLDDHGNAINQNIGEHSGAHEEKHNTLRDKLDQLQEKLHDLVAQECKGREEDINELRILIGGEQLTRAEHHGHIMTCLKEEKAKRDVAHTELHSRLDGHAESLEEKLQREQLERENLHLSLHAKLDKHGNAIQSQLGEHSDAHMEKHGSLLEQLQALENMLHEQIAQECKGREEDIDDLRNLIGGEALARTEHHGHILSRIEEEQANRDAAHVDLHGKLDAHREEANGRHAQLHSRLDDHQETMQERLAREKVERDEMHGSLHDKLHGHHGTMQERLEELEKVVDTLQEFTGQSKESQDAALAALRDNLGQLGNAHSEKHGTLQERLDDLEKTLRDEIAMECHGREADIDEMRSLVGGESAARMQHHNHILSSLDAEKAKRDAAHAELHSTIQGHVENIHGRLSGHAETLEERFQREREARDSMQNSLHERLIGHKGELDNLLTSHYALHGRLDEHSGALEERSAREQQEREAMLSLHGAFQDKVHGHFQNEKSMRDEHHGTIKQRLELLEKKFKDDVAGHRGRLEELLTREKRERETAIVNLQGSQVQLKDTIEARLAREREHHDALTNDVHERVKRTHLETTGHYDTADDRLDTLERQTNVYDGLLRKERAERTQESARLWEAVDSHTHDLSMSSGPPPLSRQSSLKRVEDVGTASLKSAKSSGEQAPMVPLSARSTVRGNGLTPVPLSPSPVKLLPAQRVPAIATPVTALIPLLRGSSPRRSHLSPRATHFLPTTPGLLSDSSVFTQVDTLISPATACYAMPRPTQRLLENFVVPSYSSAPPVQLSADQPSILSNSPSVDPCQTSTNTTVRCGTTRYTLSE